MVSLVRRLCRLTMMLTGLLVGAHAAPAESDQHSWSLQVDLQSPQPLTDTPSWLNGSGGKLRFDGSNDALSVGRIVAEYHGRIGPTLQAHVVGDYVDDATSGIDLTEAFLEWKPIPKSANRHRVRLGAFFPDVSLENRDHAWTSPYSISSSAINTWIGEEFRTIGAEWSFTHRLNQQTSSHLKFLAATYIGNDPAGTLLAWKGWSLHDRQTRLNDVLPLAPLPQVGPDGLFSHQAIQVEPFIETDDRLGYYYGAEWRVNQRVLLSALHYDNHADPLSLRDGQYGWITRFDHIGFQIEMPADFGLIGQWMDGSTGMGPFVGNARVVDTSFGSYFLLLTKRIGRHRVSVRFDDFDVVDNDNIPLDDNGEVGDAWTLSYAFNRSERLEMRMEWLRIYTARPAWAYLGLPSTATERLVQLQVALRLGTQNN